jgi:hypothetical protein
MSEPGDSPQLFEFDFTDARDVLDLVQAMRAFSHSGAGHQLRGVMQEFQRVTLSELLNNLESGYPRDMFLKGRYAGLKMFFEMLDDAIGQAEKWLLDQQQAPEKPLDTTGDTP